MIKRVKYEHIDFHKYQFCLDNSVQKKLYAEKIFLDTSTEKNWEVLIYKDYEAIMPIPLIRRMGFKIVINPKLCQQLGIFSKIDSKEINDLFYQFLIDNYNIWYYAFNDSNQFTKPLKTRKNYLLLPEKYDLVRQNYSPKRKRKLRLDSEILKKSEIVKNPNIDLVENFIEKYALVTNKNDLQDFMMLLIHFYQLKKLDFYGFFYQNRLINLIAVYNEEYSLALLGTYNDREYVKLSGSSFLIDTIIMENIETKIFDFEGSEIPAIEEFFRGFRPILKPYYCLHFTNLQVKLNILKSLFCLKKLF